jgi:hypothetical protein
MGNALKKSFIVLVAGPGSGALDDLRYAYACKSDEDKNKILNKLNRKGGIPSRHWKSKALQ